MPIGVGAAMLIGSAVAGGTAVASAKMQSNAAKDAAKLQQQGTDRALAAQREANQPYMQLGQQAAQRLGMMTANAQPYMQQFTGAGGSNGYQAFGGMPDKAGFAGMAGKPSMEGGALGGSPAQQAAMAWANQRYGPDSRVGQMVNQGLQQLPPPQSLAGLGQPPQSAADRQAREPLNVTGIDIGTRQPPTLDAYGAALRATAPQGGGMVQLQAPDGSIRPFPAAQAEALIQAARARGHELRRVG